MYLALLCLLSTLLQNSYGYQNGAPASACDGMTPNHDSNVDQVGASNYTIIPSSTTYNCGDNITVTLSGASFKGFLCQARPSANTYSTVGTLTNADGSVVTTNNCDGEAALTHTENGVKSSFEFRWTQSGTSSETFYIVCTIVEVKATFWVKESSVAISYGGTEGQCTSGADTLTFTVPLLLMCVSIIVHVISRFV